MVYPIFWFLSPQSTSALNEYAIRYCLQHLVARVGQQFSQLGGLLLVIVPLTPAREIALSKSHVCG